MVKRLLQLAFFKEGMLRIRFVRYNLGNLYTDVGLIDEALQSYLDSISLNPKFGLGHYNCALTLRLLRKSTAALKSCDKALSLNKNMANAHYIKGCILDSIDQPKEALVSLRSALAIKSDFPEAEHSIGVVLLSLGRTKEAEGAFRRAIRARPNTQRPIATSVG